MTGQAGMLQTPEWPTCGLDGYIGICVDGAERCLAHVDPQPRKAFLAGFKPGDDVDLRGTHLSSGLLNQLLTALRPKDGPPWLGVVQFERVRFDGDVGLDGAQFSQDADFSEAEFVGSAWFRQVAFEGPVSFGAARFGGAASLDGTWFGGEALFGKTEFMGSASSLGSASMEPLPSPCPVPQDCFISNGTGQVDQRLDEFKDNLQDAVLTSLDGRKTRHLRFNWMKPPNRINRIARLQQAQEEATGDVRFQPAGAEGPALDTLRRPAAGFHRGTDSRSPRRSTRWLLFCV